MAGLGRRTHYRKHLTDSIIYDFPEPGENERIAKVIATRGGNQFDIIVPSDAAAAQDCKSQNNEQKQPREGQLAILPTKFNKLVWVKRNDFVIVETGVDDDHQDTTTTIHDNKKDRNEVVSSDHNATTTTGGGIRFIISHILYKDQVKHLQSKGLWPIHDPEFATDKIMGLRDHHPFETSAVDNDNNNTNEEEADDDGIVYDTGYEDDDEFLINTNRIANLKVDDSSDDDSSDEE